MPNRATEIEVVSATTVTRVKPLDGFQEKAC